MLVFLRRYESRTTNSVVFGAGARPVTATSATGCQLVNRAHLSDTESTDELKSVQACHTMTNDEGTDLTKSIHYSKGVMIADIRPDKKQQRSSYEMVFLTVSIIDECGIVWYY